MIAKAIPLTYFLEYIRSFYGYGEANAMFGFELGIFYLLVGMIFLDRAIINARRSGMLLRLSE
jgi:ABC-2 type transport system permease protein